MDIRDISWENSPSDSLILSELNPIFKVTAKFNTTIERIITKEELQLIGRNLENNIRSGWEIIDRRIAVPAMNISVYDLCAGINLAQFMNRLSWWEIFMLDYKSPYKMARLDNFTLINKWDLYPTAMHISRAIETIARVVKQPDDPDQNKCYLSKGFTNFNVVGKSRGAIKGFDASVRKIKRQVVDIYKNEFQEYVDTEDLAIITNVQPPQLNLTVFTTAYMGNQASFQ